MTHEEAVKRANEVLADLDDQKGAILRKLEESRCKRKISVGEVGASLGKASSYYSVVLNRGRALSVESIAKLAAAFDRKIELRLVRNKR